MELEDVLILVNGQPIRVADVLAWLKVSGVFRNTVCQLVEGEVIRHKSRELGLEVGDGELQQYTTQKRRYLGLSRAEDMHQFCRNHGVTLAQWQEAAKLELLCARTRGRVVSDEAVGEYFRANREALRTLQVSRLVCAARAEAEAFKARAAAGETTFAELARRHSLEENTRSAGGYLGTIRRRMLPPKMDAALFAAAAGEVVGPFEEKGCWSLFRVDAVREPELNDGLRKEIADRLFAAWLQKAIAVSRFERPE